MRRRRKRNIAWILAGLVVVAVVGGPASAHGLVVFATADGSTVRGSAYFAGGGKARDAEVTVFAPDGARLAETVTDEKGGFRFEATVRCDHRIAVQASDAHRATYTLSAAELPPELPAWEGGPEPARGDVSGGRATRPAAPAPGGRASELRTLAGQVRQLRADLRAYHSQARLHEVIGGIGYIVGLAGVVSFLLARRARRAKAD